MPRTVLLPLLLLHSCPLHRGPKNDWSGHISPSPVVILPLLGGPSPVICTAKPWPSFPVSPHPSLPCDSTAPWFVSLSWIIPSCIRVSGDCECVPLDQNLEYASLISWSFQASVVFCTQWTLTQSLCHRVGCRGCLSRPIKRTIRWAYHSAQGVNWRGLVL